MPTVLPSDFLRLKAIYSESSERWHQGFHYDICKDCREDPPTIIEDFQTGDVICGSCGLVLESNLVDTRPEWRTFSNDDSISGADPNRVGDGPDESLIGDQLSTSISFIGGSDSTNQALQRAQNKIVKDGQDGKMNQNLKAAFATLSAYISAAHLSKVVNDTAIKIMKVCMMEKCIKTTPSCVECAVIIYKATKAVGEAREIKECMRIVCLDQLKRKAFNAAYKRIDQVLREVFMKAENKQNKLAEATGGKEGEEMKKKIAQTSDMPRAVMSARQVLPRFCEQARLKAWQRSLTEAFADAVEDTQALDSRGPSNVAATSLYIVTALFGEPMAMKDAAMLAQFSTSTIKKAFFLATERKAEIIASTKFPRDSRLNLSLWPSIDGKRAAKSSPTTSNAPMVATPPAPMLSPSPGPVNVPQLAPLSLTSPIPKSSPEQVNLPKTTSSNIPVTSAGAMPPPPRRFKYTTGTTRPTFSPIVSNSNGGVNANSHKCGASDIETATEAIKPAVKRENSSHPHPPTLPHHTLLNSGVVGNPRPGKRSASALDNPSEDGKSPAKRGEIPHAPSLSGHGMMILKKKFDLKTAPAIVKPAVMKRIGPRKLVLPKVNNANVVSQHISQPILQLAPQAIYQSVPQSIPQIAFQPVSQPVYEGFPQNSSHLAGSNIGSNIDINTYTAAQPSAPMNLVQPQTQTHNAVSQVAQQPFFHLVSQDIARPIYQAFPQAAPQAVVHIPSLPSSPIGSSININNITPTPQITSASSPMNLVQPHISSNTLHAMFNSISDILGSGNGAGMVNCRKRNAPDADLDSDTANEDGQALVKRVKIAHPTTVPSQNMAKTPRVKRPVKATRRLVTPRAQTGGVVAQNAVAQAVSQAVSQAVTQVAAQVATLNIPQTVTQSAIQTLSQDAPQANPQAVAQLVPQSASQPASHFGLSNNSNRNSNMATIPQNAIDLVLPQTKAPVSNDISHNTVSQAVSDHAALNTGSNIVSDTQSNISSNINNRNIAAILTAGPPMKTVLPEVDPVASHNTTSQAITQSAASHPVGSNINKSPKNTAPNRGTTAFSTAVSGPPMKLLLPQTEGDNGVSHNNVSQSVSQTLPQTIAQSASRPAELNNMSTIKSAPNPQTSTATAGTSNKLVQTQAQAHDTHAVYYPASNTASNTGLKAVSQLAAQSTYHLVSHNEPNIDSKSNTAANIHTTTATGAAANLPKKLVLPQTQAHNAQIVTLPASEPSYHPFSHTGPHKRSNSKIATNPRTITAANPPMKLVPQAQIHPAQTVSHDLSLTGPNTGLNTRPNINTNNISTNPGTSTHANVVTRNTVAHSRSDTGSKTGSNNKTRKIATNPLACAATPPMKLVPQAQARDAQDVSHTTSPPGSHTVSQPRSHAVLNTNHSDMATTLQTPMKSVLPQAQANNAQTASYHASNTGSNTGLNIVSQPTSQAVSHPGSQPVSQALSHPGHHPSMPNTVVNLNTSITNISTPHQTATTLALPQTQVNANAVSHTGLNAIFHPSPHSIPHLSSHTNLTNHNISGLGASAMTSRRKRSADEADLDAKNLNTEGAEHEHVDKPARPMKRLRLRPDPRAKKKLRNILRYGPAV